MAGVVTAVCYSLNNIIIYWTFYKKMLSISAGPYLSVSITQRWGVENLPLSSHALASFRGSLGFQCTTTLLAQQKKKSPFEGDAQQKKNPHLRGIILSIKFCSTVSVSSQLMWNCYIHYCCCCCCFGFLGMTTDEPFSLF